MITRAEVEQAFRDMVKSLHCPACELEFTDFAVEWGRAMNSTRQGFYWWEEFTDFAVEWGRAWCEGRMDLMDEHGWQERDGPFKLKCELCGHRWWLNYFAKSVTSAEPHGRDGR